MDTPLYLALKEYQKRDPARFHMPGHKGVLPAPLDGAAPWDITEVEGAGSLYASSGPIAETEAAFARIYGAGASLLSAGGSTLCIQTMLALFLPPGGTVLAARGVHTAAVNAMALLDLHPRWLYPEIDPATGLALPVTPRQVSRALSEIPADAVYLTSPDYFGSMADIAGIAAACRRRGVPLLVDNAHGAHLHLLSPSPHPMGAGADACCDSLHKTLPCLTGAALLHLRDKARRDRAKTMMSLFGSTSPSYLILLSADRCLGYLQGGAHRDLDAVSQQVAKLAALAEKRGFALPAPPTDPLRLALGFSPLGYTADAFGAALRRAGVEPEYLSGAFCVLLGGSAIPAAHWERLRSFVENLPPLPARQRVHPPFPPVRPRRRISLRRALFAPAETLPVEHCAGRTAAAAVAPCPPGIPLVLPGEELDQRAVLALKSVGIHTASVLK